jgi:predicted RecB family nuclease
MRVNENKTVLTATDLANHLSCCHLTMLDLRLAKGEVAEPTWSSPHLRVLQERGREHERNYIESLRAKGMAIVDLSAETTENAKEATSNAMRAGAQVIVQASFVSGDWRGRPDVLLRVDRNDQPSRFGKWSYEAVDCKLARDTKAEAILQLCLYSDLLTEIQGLEPELLHVIPPSVDFKPESYRYASFAAYYRAVKKALFSVVQSGNDPTYPEPVPHCDICRWWKECDHQRRKDDHLSFVAGASKLQRKELLAQGVPRLEALAKLPIPIPFKPSRGARDGYVRIREQARIQFEARVYGSPKFEMLNGQTDEGLARLPAPSLGDLFFDIEGDPFVGEGGLEYLFGTLTLGEHEQLEYNARWAADRAQERAAFEWLIDWIFARTARFPDLHIYHFGAYEVSAVKRLMLRYATREEEVDRLLRGDRFVNLHTIVKKSLRASVEQYSLKEMEKFCGYIRMVPLSEANPARHFIEHQLELGAPIDTNGEICATVRAYNQDDCKAAERLRQWLEDLRSRLASEGKDLARPALKDTSPTEEVAAQKQRVETLFNSLTKDLPPEPSNRSFEQAAKWLLAHALDWHRREEKVKWWEFFRMKDCSEEELYDEKTALAGLVHLKRMPKSSPRERAPIDQYRYPPQECSIKRGDTLYTLDEQKFGEVVADDSVARTIDIKKPIKLEAVHPTCAFAHARYPTTEHSESILRLGDWIVTNGINAPGAFRAARDLLLGNAPRLSGTETLQSLRGETSVETACRIGLALDNSTLAIQGPPGAGKTFTGARMVCEMVRNGRKVGITAVSHKVIRKLLDEVLKAARELKVAGLRCAHRTESGAAGGGPISEIGSNEEALSGLQSGAVNVLGGTSWLWTRREFAESVDCLVVDEAGQMSLANVLACAPVGKNLVLLGDPQQLEQPQKGSHPEGSDISALSHLLAGKKTIGDDRGLFLRETWRLHPAICGFTSELFYEGRLASLKTLEQQDILGSEPFIGAGLWLVPTTHEGNQTYSPEEVDRIAQIVELLTQPASSWTDRHGRVQRLTLDHILVVAPYNDQVNRLSERLPTAKVGTVDRFQGQEAPVVIYSLTTSAPEDAPRGMEFLYNLNRFNVATSRARCAVIMVGNVALLSPECRTPHQMELANVLCRYAELCKVVELGSPNEPAAK